MAAHLNVLERDADINGDGNVVLTTPELQYAQIPAEYVINHVVLAIAMMQLVQINNNNNEVLGINVVDDGNGENSHLDAEHANPTSELLPENVTDHENGHASQLDGDHANRSYGIYKLLNIYAVSQAGILAAVSSVRGWSRLVLSGLVSTAIIVVLLIKFCQQFRQLREEEYRTWVAQKAAIVVMLMAMSLCLLLSFT